MNEAKPLSRGQWQALVAAFLGWMFVGFEMGLFPIVARPGLQNILAGADDKLVGAWNGWITACFLLGAAAGGLVFGWLGDRLGRVRALALSVVTYSLFTGLKYFAAKAWHLAALRFAASLGLGGEWSLGVALVVECWPERLRPMLAGVIGAAANVGFLLIAAIGTLAPATRESWRWMFLVGAVPALLAVYIVLFVPESQRWKAAVSHGASRPLHEIFARGLWKTTLLAIVFASIPLIGTWAAVSGWLPVWADQLAEKPALEAAKNEILPALSDKERLVSEDVLAQFVVRVAVAKDAQAESQAAADTLKAARLTPAEIARLTERVRAALAQAPQAREMIVKLKKRAAPAKAKTQVLLSIGAIIGCFFAPIIGGRTGRRPAYFGLCLLSLVFCGYLFRWLEAYDAQFLVVSGVVGLVTAAFYGWLPLYLPELFPTRVRATGQGLSFNFGRILAAAGAVQMGQLVSLLGGSYARAGATITLIYVLGLVLIWFAPETKGKPLPE